MTRSVVARTEVTEAKEAGISLGRQIVKGLDGLSPDALIVFASSIYDYCQLLSSLQEECKPRLLVGCSSAGEFVSDSQGEGSACAVGLRSSEMVFRAGKSWIGMLHCSSTRCANV